MCDEPADLLETCPRCGYSLRGLPTEHVCPECGLAFDRCWRILAGPAAAYRRSRGYRVFHWVVLGLSSFLFCGNLAMGMTALSAGDPSGLVFTAFYGLILAGGVIPFLLPRRPAFIAVGPAGLVIYHKDRAVTYEWSRVGRARYELRSSAVVIELDKGKLVLTNRRFFPGGVAEAESCMRGINHYPREGDSK